MALDAMGADHEEAVDRPTRPDAGRLLIPVTPGGAFAAAAVIVSAAALLFTLGRRYPGPLTTGSSNHPAAMAGTSDALPSVAYETLEIDPGAR